MSRRSKTRCGGLALFWLLLLLPSLSWGQSGGAERPSSPKDYASEVSQLLQQENLDEARKILDQGLSLYPKSVLLWDLEVDLAFAKQDFSSALVAAKMAHTLQPTATRSVRIGHLYVRKEEPKSALKYLEQSIEAANQWPDLYYLIGWCYDELGQSDEAIASFERYLGAVSEGSQVDHARQRIARLSATPTPAPSPGGNRSGRPARPSGGPRWDCCWQIWGTGCNLGWATALLRYTRERTRWEPADELIDSFLLAAGRHVQTSYSVCSQLTPAWADWSSRSQLIERNRERFRSTPDSSTRNQVYQAIQATRLWGSALNMQAAVVNDRTEVIGHRSTCAEKYFELGHHISYAQLTLKIADEWLQAGRNDFNPLVVEAKNRLRRCLDLLDDYELIRTGDCVDLEPLDLHQRINAIVAKNDFPNNGPRMIIGTDRVQLDLQQRLQSHCPASEDLDVEQEVDPATLLVFSFRDFNYHPWSNGGGTTHGGIHLTNNGDEGITLTERYDHEENSFVCDEANIDVRQVNGRKSCFRLGIPPEKEFFHGKGITSISIGPGETERVAYFTVMAFGEFQFSQRRLFNRFKVVAASGEQTFIETPVYDVDAFYDGFRAMEDGQPAKFRSIEGPTLDKKGP